MVLAESAWRVDEFGVFDSPAYSTSTTPPSTSKAAEHLFGKKSRAGIDDGATNCAMQGLIRSLAYIGANSQKDPPSSGPPNWATSATTGINGLAG